MHGAIAEAREGTCVLTAVKNTDQASAAGCRQLPAEFRECTPFSGHLLNILSHGTKAHNDMLTLGLIRDAIRKDMHGCGTYHDLPRMILNDAPEGTLLFTNRMAPSDREDPPSIPESPEDWVRAMIGGENEFDRLFEDPRKAGQVVSLLSKEPADAGKSIALSVNRRASEIFQQPKLFARYWAEAGQALTA